MFLLRGFGSGKPHAHTHASHVLAKLQHIRCSEPSMDAIFTLQDIYATYYHCSLFCSTPYLTEVSNGTIGSFSQQNGSYTQEESLECGKDREPCKASSLIR